MASASPMSSSPESRSPSRAVADNTGVDVTLLTGDPGAFDGSDEPTLRRTASPWALLRQSAGGPRAMLHKLGRLGHALLLTVNARETARRLQHLKARGFIADVPTHVQVLGCGFDMLRYFIKPGAEAYYATKGINPGFHYVLRILDDPASMIDPVGVRSARDTIIGHVLQVVHANPVYDFQLLEMFPDGMDEMEGQTQMMLDGTHPRQASIGAIVEDPDYHARLLGYIERYREDPTTPQLIRRTGDARSDPGFVLAEMTFGTLPSAMRYASRLPRTVPAALRHYRAHRTIRPELCDPHVVAAHREAYPDY